MAVERCYFDPRLDLDFKNIEMMPRRIDLVRLFTMSVEGERRVRTLVRFWAKKGIELTPEMLKIQVNGTGLENGWFVFVEVK